MKTPRAVLCLLPGAPGDIIAMMGLAVKLCLDVFCYVPPHDDAEKWNANTHYKSMQFRCSTKLQKRPCVYLVIRSGHFKALATATTAPSSKHTFSVLDLFQTEKDPATSKYVAQETAVMLSYSFIFVQFCASNC
jgi:hypothetical protein